jgi:molybdenum cofactor synthesis domain-containing protein
MITSEIIAVGNELLLGDVLDTNTNWVCKKITGIGGYIERAVLVRDNLTAIVRELHSALDRNTNMIFTIGGMGPTQDDITVEAVAKATDHPLELNTEALAIVKRRYEQFAREGAVDDASITPAREKMAHLPIGATPLDNPVGAAPAVVLHWRNSTIVCLPGVPAELKGIFESSLQPILQQVFGDSTFVEKLVTVNCKDESVLAPVLKTVSDRYPEVYIKSRAKRFGPDVKFRVTLSMAGSSKKAVEQRIDESLQGLRQALSNAGISIDSVEEQ